MADIELVIKIPERDYDLACKYPDALIATYAHYIKDGTPLPKGHGRLIDAEAFTQSMCTYQQTGCGSCNHQLCCPEDAPTIIEADQVESGDKE